MNNSERISSGKKQARRIGERVPRSSAWLEILDDSTELRSAKSSARNDARHAKNSAFCMKGPSSLLARLQNSEQFGATRLKRLSTQRNVIMCLFKYRYTKSTAKSQMHHATRSSSGRVP